MYLEQSRRLVAETLGGLPKASFKRSLRVRAYLGLLFFDCLSIAGGFLLANLARFGEPLNDAGLTLVGLVIPLFLLSAFHNGAYSVQALMRAKVGVRAVMTALALTAAIILLMAFSLKTSAGLSRLVFAAGLAFSGTLLLYRVPAARFIRSLLDGSASEEVLLVDGGTAPQWHGARVIDARSIGLTPDSYDPMMLDKLSRLLEGVDRLVVACAPEARVRWALLLKGANIDGEILAPELDRIGAIGVGQLGTQSTFKVSCGPLSLRSRFVKRMFDLAITLPLLVLLAPLLVVAAIAIKLDSPGPLFFVQPRLGRSNQLFSVFKFRTMRVEDSDMRGTNSTRRDDARITRIGRILRASSIDELPQLFNVLRGEMSLVGPRPHALGSLAGDQLFWEVDQRYWHRHAAKPGITGLAQVRGHRGATSSTNCLTQRLQADLEYLDDWSVWRDIGILLRTFGVVRHRNAF